MEDLSPLLEDIVFVVEQVNCAFAEDWLSWEDLKGKKFPKKRKKFRNRRSRSMGHCGSYLLYNKVSSDACDVLLLASEPSPPL
jgi:hypothetical protein